MGIRDRVEKWALGRILKQSASLGLELRGLGSATASWPKHSPKDYVEQGYNKNMIAYYCVNLVASSIASVPLELVRVSMPSGEEEEVKDHDILDLLSSPNPDQGYSVLVENYWSHYLISGDSYLEEVPGLKGLPKELWVKRPDRMKVKVDGNDGIVGHVLQTANGSHTWEKDERGFFPILHLHTFNPADDFYGLSPIEAATNNLVQHNEIDLWNWNLMHNGDAISGHLETDKDPGSESVKRIQKEWRKYKGAGGNVNDIPVLSSGLKYVGGSFSPEQMAIIENKSITARFICHAFKVPPYLLGLPEGATFNNVADARLYFWDTTIIPLVNRWVEELNKWLVARWEESGLQLRPNFDSVPALEPRRQQKWDRIMRADFLTFNEKRQELGYDAIEGGDVLYIPANLLPLGGAEETTLEDEVKLFADYMGDMKEEDFEQALMSQFNVGPIRAKTLAKLAYEDAA